MPQTRGQGSQDRQKETPEKGGTAGQRELDSEATSETGYDSDQPEVGNTDNQKSVAPKQAAENEALEKVARKEEAAKPAEGELKKPSVPNSKDIGQRFKKLITESRKGLQNMYGEKEEDLDKNLKGPIEKGEEMATKLVNAMGCGPEVAKDLTVLTLYDVAILIDDSDSMVNEEDGARKKTLIQFVDHITEIYSMANKSGILALRFMNGSGGKKNWTGKSRKYLDRHSYEGLTRIGTELKKKILDFYAIRNSKQSKPLLVLIVTDGAVEGEKEGYLKEVIRDCVNERKEAGKGFDAVSFQFSRIGNDSGAAKLLEDLDDDPELGGFVDVLPVEFDLEKQLKNKWFVLPKILLGAILPIWDGADYRDKIQVPDHIGNEGNDSKNETPEGDWEADSDTDGESSGAED